MFNPVHTFLDVALFICSDWYGIHQPSVVAEKYLGLRADVHSLAHEDLVFIAAFDEFDNPDPDELDYYESIVQDLYSEPVTIGEDVYFPVVDCNGAFWLVPSNTELPEDF